MKDISTKFPKYINRSFLGTYISLVSLSKAFEIDVPTNILKKMREQTLLLRINSN